MAKWSLETGVSQDPRLPVSPLYYANIKGISHILQMQVKVLIMSDIRKR